MIRWLKHWRDRQTFDPGPFGWVSNPFYIARRGLHGALTVLLPELRGEVLDVGCGTKPYRTLIPATRYVGLDYDSPERRGQGFADVFYDGDRFPFEDGSFDGVLCTQVLEHVFNPEEFLREVARVLRPGGTLVLTVPFVWDEHEQPHDFARYSSFGLRAMLERNGFVVARQEKTPADFSVVAQLAAGWFYKLGERRGCWTRRLLQFGVIAPINLFGGLLAVCLPPNPDLYLDNVVLARRLAPDPSAP